MDWIQIRNHNTQIGFGSIVLDPNWIWIYSRDGLGFSNNYIKSILNMKQTRIHISLFYFSYSKQILIRIYILPYQIQILHSSEQIQPVYIPTHNWYYTQTHDPTQNAFSISITWMQEIIYPPVQERHNIHSKKTGSYKRIKFLCKLEVEKKIDG